MKFRRIILIGILIMMSFGIKVFAQTSGNNLELIDIYDRITFSNYLSYTNMSAPEESTIPFIHPIKFQLEAIDFDLLQNVKTGPLQSFDAQIEDDIWYIHNETILASADGGGKIVFDGATFQEVSEIYALGGTEDENHGLEIKIGFSQISGEMRAYGGDGASSYGFKTIGPMVQGEGTLIAVAGIGDSAYGAYANGFFQVYDGTILAVGRPNASGLYAFKENGFYGEGEVQLSGVVIVDNYYNGTAIYSEGSVGLNTYIRFVPSISLSKVEEQSPALIYSEGKVTIRKGVYLQEDDETFLIPQIHDSYMLAKMASEKILLVESDTEIITVPTLVDITRGRGQIFDLIVNSITLGYDLEVETEGSGEDQKIKRLYLTVTRNKTPMEALNGLISSEMNMFLFRVYELAGSYTEFNELISILDNLTSTSSAAVYVSDLEYSWYPSITFAWENIAVRLMKENDNLLHNKLSGGLEFDGYSLWCEPSYSIGTIEDEHSNVKERTFAVNLGAIYSVNKLISGIQLGGFLGDIESENSKGSGRGLNLIIGAKCELPVKANKFLNPYIELGLGYLYNKLDMTREETISEEMVAGSTSQNALQINFILGDRIDFSDKFNLYLMLGANYLNVKTSEYKENTGSAFDISLSEARLESLNMVIGGTIEFSLLPKLSVYVNAFYTMELFNLNSNPKLSFDSIDNFEIVYEREVVGSYLDASFGMKVNISHTIDLSFNYYLHKHNGYFSNSIGIALGVKI